MPQSVLIVDDSLPLQELVKVHLAELELVMHSAFDGSSALALAGSVKPDLVLLDVDLPDMNGFDVCRVLKTDAETTGIPIVFLTAACSPDEKVCGLELRAVDYITKPFEPAELCARVRAALRTRRLLELLPKTARRPQPPVPPKFGANSKSVNERLSMAQLMRARSANPWSRKPPSASQQSTPPTEIGSIVEDQCPTKLV